MTRKLRIAITASMLILTSGCVIGPRRGIVYVRRAPPPVRVEVRPVFPGDGYAWMAGYWTWRRDDFLWVPGHWVVVPHGFHGWVNGRWDRDRNGWFYIQGYWR